MQVDILAIGVHPDDVELCCSGTLLKHIAMGHTVGLLDLTRGELGSRGTAEIRAREAARAAELLGARFRKNLGMPDGFFQYAPEYIRAIVRVLRWCRPRIVLMNAPSDRHPDHGRAARLCADALFYSGLVKIETRDEEGRVQQPHRPEAAYHYIQDVHLEADFAVDITPWMDRKLELIQAFESQFHNPNAGRYADQPQTPISGKDFLEYLRARARVYGRPIGAEYAEGFICLRTPGVDSLFDLK